jgi:hypothetical protein
MSDAPLCYGEVGLRDVLNNDLDPQETRAAEFRGFFIQPQGGGTYHVQYDGHIGSVLKFHRDEYDDVLELVDDLVDCLIRLNDFEYRADKEGLVEWAGKIATEDAAKVEENPELYLQIPEYVEGFDGG